MAKVKRPDPKRKTAMRYGPDDEKDRTMRRFYRGELKRGRSGASVKSVAQALAIAHKMHGRSH